MKKTIIIACSLIINLTLHTSLTSVHAQITRSDAAALPAPSVAPADANITLPEVPAPEQHETLCTGGQDEDGDSLADCADADCYHAANCQTGQGEERTNQACSDWVDNDGDGATDCDDRDCQESHVTMCKGSWGGGASSATSSHGAAAQDDALPQLSSGMSVEDLIGTGTDKDGERNDELCSDGIDNDGDGRTDCADFGCKFDPAVVVCSGAPGIRFSAVVGVGASYQWDYDQANNVIEQTPDIRFSRIQLRALGPIPFIERSFFLINIRAERTFRLTFANFQLPLGNAGHYVSLNSGSGTLSSGLITSIAKQALLDPPFYLFNSFEQGNGAAVEIGGPITDDKTLSFRSFFAGGAGEFNGNVGGRFFRSDERNFSWTAGGQLQYDFKGRIDRFDSQYIYTALPLAASVRVGAKYEQRSTERFMAWNAYLGVRAWHFILGAESYSKYVFDYNSIQTAWNLQVSALLVPKTLMLAADVGGFHVPQGYNASAPSFDATFRRPVPEWQWRAALHWYFFRNIGIVSAVYGEHRYDENPDNTRDPRLERNLRLEAQFRF